MNKSSWDAIIAAACSLLIAAGAWAWQYTALRNDQPSAVRESWRQVHARYPMPETFQDAMAVSPAMLQSVIHANPFSPDRRPPAPVATTEAVAVVAQPPPAQFIYKGRIVMGSAQRAILEEAHSRKTYFLQVGQEVAGFKVLDIEESRVLLSDLKTNEELAVSLAQSKR